VFYNFRSRFVCLKTCQKQVTRGFFFNDPEQSQYRSSIQQSVLPASQGDSSEQLKQINQSPEICTFKTTTEI